MKCPKCNHENEGWAAYCKVCQANLKETVEQQMPQDIQKQDLSEKPTQTREPILAGILSFFYLGLGQAYNGQRRKGYMFFLSIPLLVVFYFILHMLFGEVMPKKGEEAANFGSPSYLFTSILWMFVWGYNIYDAYKSAQRVNNGEIIVDSTPGRSSFIFLRNVILSCVLLFVLFFSSIAAILESYLLKARTPRQAQLGIMQKPVSEENPIKKFVDTIRPNSPKPVIDKKSAEGGTYKIDGISYSKSRPLVSINGQPYGLNDSFQGGKIIDISQEKIKIKFPANEKEYRLGDVISIEGSER